MRKARLFSAVLAGSSVFMLGSSAFGQLMGTVFVDFDGHTGTNQGDVDALDAVTFPDLSPADTDDLKAGIMAVLQADYAGYSINITDIDPGGGSFTRLVIGSTGTVDGDVLGISNEIDFRNKRQVNQVSAVAEAHISLQPTWSVAQAARDLGQTASHEVAHVLGLVHADVVSTFEGGGAPNVAQELMAAATQDEFRLNDLSFGVYSKVKLDISQNGINVQPEAGAAAFVAGFGADPARAGDAGATVAAGTVLSVDANGRACALGTLGGADTTDVFKFTGVTGQHISAEAFSLFLSDFDGAGPSIGRIANPMDPIISLLNSAGVVIATEEYNINSDMDGASPNGNPADFGTESLLFNFTLPANDTYGLRVTTRGGGDNNGLYELLFIPEPSTVTLLAAAGLMALRRRRA